MADEVTSSPATFGVPTPEAPVALESAPAPVVASEQHPDTLAAAAVDKAVTAVEVADAEHVTVVVEGTHILATSLLHDHSTYVTFVENGVTRIEQIIGSRR